MRYSSIVVTPFQQNCSVLWCEETLEAGIIDPGGDTDRIIDFITENNLKVTTILLTHGHLDHAGGTNELKEHYGVPVTGPHRDDEFLLSGMQSQCSMFGFGKPENIHPDRWLEDNDQVSVGSLTLTVRHCPGHTPGHVVFIDEIARKAFVGDVLFSGSIGRTDFPRGDYSALISSIRERLFPMGQDIGFIPGHGPESTFGREEQTNPYVGQGDGF